jgi:acylphosphatase
VRLHIVVIGQVQGVGFRRFVEREGSARGLAGWVRNRPDGSVEVEVEGSDDEVARFRDVLRQGPRHAFVERLEESTVASGAPLPTPFAVRFY